MFGNVLHKRLELQYFEHSIELIEYEYLDQMHMKVVDLLFSHQLYLKEEFSEWMNRRKEKQSLLEEGLDMSEYSVDEAYLQEKYQHQVDYQ